MQNILSKIKSKPSVIVILIISVLLVGGFLFYKNEISSSDTSKSSGSSSISSLSSIKPVKVGDGIMYPNKNAFDNLSSVPSLSLFVEYSKSADLVKILNGNGPYTIFAPDNSAFSAISKSTIEDILKPENKTKLVDILNNHIVAGRFLTADLKDGQLLTTIGGDVLQINKKDSKTFVNYEEIITSDLVQTNGTVHIVNKVLINLLSYTSTSI